MISWKRKNRAEGKGMVSREAGELCYLTFPAFTETGLVEHLFSTRMGGVSKGIFATMNLSFTRGDEEAAVQENFRRIAKVMHGKKDDFVCSDQTHTVNIRKVTKEDKGKGVLREKDYRDIDGRAGDYFKLLFCGLRAALFSGYEKEGHRSCPFRMERHRKPHGTGNDSLYGKGIRLPERGYDSGCGAVHLCGLL